MRQKVEDSQKIIEKTKSQSNQTKAILDFTNSTLRTSWTLNSIISLFSIKGFNTQSYQKNKLENLLDSILIVREIFVASLYSSTTEMSTNFINTALELIQKITKIRTNLMNSQISDDNLFINIRIIEELSKKIADYLETKQKEIASEIFEKEFKIIFPKITSQIIQELRKLE
jgi:hypothetical protein